MLCLNLCVMSFLHTASFVNSSVISGHFGCVYKGYLQTPGEKGEQIVAAKTLHRENCLVTSSIASPL